MDTMAQSSANWRNTHTHADHMHSLTHLHQHSYNHVVRNAGSAITEFGSKILIFTVPEGTIYIYNYKLHLYCVVSYTVYK